MKLISLGSVFLLCLAAVSVIVAENREEEIQQLGAGEEIVDWESFATSVHYAKCTELALACI